MLPMQPFSGKLRCPCVGGSRPSHSARRTRHTLSLVVTVDQRQVHRPSRRPIKIKMPALCLRRTPTRGRGTLHLKLMQAEKAKPTQVVVEPDKATETPLGMTSWSASGQGHDCDEAAGGEADAVVPPASAEEVYSAMSVEDRIAMRKDCDKKGLVRPDEFEDFLWNNGPDPLLLAITRLWEERERRKLSQAASLESAGEEGLAPGTIQACRAKGAGMVKAVKSAVRQAPSRKAREGAHPCTRRFGRPVLEKREKGRTHANLLSFIDLPYLRS